MTTMEDTFRVITIDPDGKKFDSVSRIEAESEKFEIFMILDVNTEVYPIKENEKFVVLLTPTLNKDGSLVSDYYAQSGRDTIADKFEYIMFGKIFRIQEEGSGSNTKTEVYISFGGLLMMLKGQPSDIGNYEIDQKLFLCMRRL